MESSQPLVLIVKALVFAARKHRHQRRKDAEASPYINHPIALAAVLCNEAGIVNPVVIAAALLHDTLEDTDTLPGELKREFGTQVAQTVREVSDDKTLSKIERKRLQIQHAPALSYEARLVELADKICNVRDMASSPPQAWTLERRREYFDWAKEVVERLRGTHETLEKLFDEAYQRRP